jgi:hypothetical protein
MALTVGAEECAHKADDLTGFVPPGPYRPLTVPAFSLFSRHPSYSFRISVSVRVLCKLFLGFFKRVGLVVSPYRP